MKQALWIAGLVLIVAGVSIRFVKQRSAVLPPPVLPAIAPRASTSLPPSKCPAYTLDDNGVCVPVPRSIPSAAN